MAEAIQQRICALKERKSEISGKAVGEKERAREMWKQYKARCAFADPDKTPPFDPDREYIGEDGELYCLVCSRPKSATVTMECGERVRTNCPCLCRQEAIQQRKTELKEYGKQMKAKLQRDKFVDHPAYRSSVFSRDDGRRPDLTDTFRRLADEYAEKGCDQGLILTGPHGCGKTFYAACVVNTLLEKGMNVQMLLAGEAVDKMRNSDANAEFVSQLYECDLLVLDDLHDSFYKDRSIDVIRDIVTRRRVAKKPTWFTTTLSEKFIKNPPPIWRESMQAVLQIARVFPVGSDE